MDRSLRPELSIWQVAEYYGFIIFLNVLNDAGCASLSVTEAAGLLEETSCLVIQTLYDPDVAAGAGYIRLKHVILILCLQQR